MRIIGLAQLYSNLFVDPDYLCRTDLLGVSWLPHNRFGTQTKTLLVHRKEKYAAVNEEILESYQNFYFLEE